ncbi:hypothetical protein HK105_201419 [Polyrhizophydium stewartii]|uniref:Uncharacterized protein n=1 Tax=Polyrhizophydium stewartii TaxID=2732419 RepID=A0ABR4NHZ6_9FUNG
MGALVNLTSLRIVNCGLSGPIPKPIAGLKDLKELLEILDLGFNELGGTLPGWIGDMPSIKSLGLAFNAFKGTVPASLARAQSMVSIELQGNSGLRGRIPDELAGLKSLHSLDLHMTELSGGPFSGVDAFPALTSINIANTAFSPNAFAFLAGRQMDAIALSAPDGTVPAWIKDTNPASLSMRKSGIAQLPEWFSSFKRLASLDLSGNKLARVPSVVGTMTRLEIINLADNAISGDLAVLRVHPRLRSINLARNNLSGPVRNTCFRKRSFPQSLDISDNDFEGDVGGCFDHQAYTLLNLRGNSKLHGNADAEFVVGVGGGWRKVCDFSSTAVCAPGEDGMALCTASCAFEPAGALPPAVYIGAVALFIVVAVVGSAVAAVYGKRRDGGADGGNAAQAAQADERRPLLAEAGVGATSDGDGDGGAAHDGQPRPTLVWERYADQVAHWPTEGRHVLAQFTADTVVVYQAFNQAIGHAAVRQQRLAGAPGFKLDRMSWIKPGFLWMMHRCGWGSGLRGQEAVLAIHMRRAAFEAHLAAALVLGPGVVPGTARGRDVVVQWDPDYDPRDVRLGRRAVQIGLRGDALGRFARDEIVAIEDITQRCRAAHAEAAVGSASLETPRERVLVLGGE